MLRRNADKSVSICDGFRTRNFFHMGRGVLPLLAVMLLATPPLAFANGLTVTINPNSLDLDETNTSGDQYQYSVVLDTEPDEAVMIAVVGEKNDSGGIVVRGSNGQQILTLSPGTLTFNLTGAKLWSDRQYISVTPVADFDGVNERVTLTHTATIGDDVVTLRDATVRVFVEDPGVQGVSIVSVDPLEVPEAGDAATYTVKLDTRPTGTVTVDIGGATGEISVSPSRLVFTPDPVEDYSADGSETREVKVSAGRDFDADNDTATLTHRVSGADYSTVRAESVDVRVIETGVDTRGIEVSTPTGTATMPVAAGSSGVFTIRLTSQPKGAVVVEVEKDPSATDNNQVKVTPDKITFSARKWNEPQDVKITATSKADEAEGDQPRAQEVRVVLSVDTDVNNRDVDYNDAQLSRSTITVGIQADLSDIGITLSPGSLTVRERSSGTYTVKLSKSPAENAQETVYLRSTDINRVTVEPSEITFSAAESDENTSVWKWNDRQEVTVRAIRDPDAVEERVVVEHRWDTTGPVVKTLTVNIDELDTRGVTVSNTDLEIGEGESASDSYTLALESKPANDKSVTVTISSSSTNVIVDPSQLTFTERGISQPVTVTAIEDKDAEPNASATLTHTVRGADYDNEKVDKVIVTVREEDMHGIVITPDELMMTEGGSDETYTVKLNSEPTGTVTIQLRSDSDDLTVKPSQLKFTAGDWNIEQTVRVTAEHDDDGEHDPAATITHRASGGGYNNVSKDVTVTVTDDDDAEKGVALTRSSLTVTEGGPEDRYTLALQTQPTGTVSVRVEIPSIPSDIESRIHVNPSSLTFKRSNWNTPQMVRVRAPEDDIDHDRADLKLTHTLRGGGYDSVMAEVAVAIRDNDTAALVVHPTSLQIVRESHQDYTVALATKPRVDVVVTVTESTVAIASPRELTFTSSNWSSPKRVRVQAATGDADETVLLENSVSSSTDPKYGAGNFQSVTVTVEVRGTGSKGVAVSPRTLTIEEGESESYTMVLTAEPTKNVKIAITGAEDDVRINTSSRTFSPSNWNTPQSVKVTIVEDDDARDDREVILQHEITSEDGEYANYTPSSVTVTPKDDDQERVLVSPTSLTVAAGSSGTYKVKLNSRPTSDVTVRVDDPAIEAVTVEGPPLVFTTSNWRSEQTVTVKVDAERGAEEEQTVTLTHTASGGNGYPERTDIPFVTVRIPVEGVPSAPTGLSASAGDRRVTLRWTAPSRDGGSAITGYEYRYREEGGSYGGWRAASSSTSATVTGLDSGTTYEFQVRARNDIGPGPESNTARATLDESAPGAPAGLTATAGDESVTLNWNAPADSGSQLLGYEYRYRESGGTYGDLE